MRTALVLIGLCAAMDARALERDEAEARQLFLDGKAAFERRDFATSLELFKHSYLVSHASALLFNMAAALEGMGRPHEAAEELRAYLRVEPTDADRPAIEQRAQALEEAQRILDQQRAPPPSSTVAPLAPPPETRPPPAIVLAPPPAAEPARSRRPLYVGLAVAGAVVIVVAAIAIGLAASGGSSTDFSASTLGTHAGTN